MSAWLAAAGCRVLAWAVRPLSVWDARPARHPAALRGGRWARAATVWLGLGLTGQARAGAPPAMATAVAGDVRVVHGTAAPFALVPFARVVAGDTLQVPAGGRVQLVFQANGRREAWSGPAVIRVGADRSEGEGTVVATELGQDVGAGLQTLTVMLTQAERERGGATMIRGEGPPPPLDAVEQEAVDAARASYARVSGQRVSPDDITAELVFAATLLTYSQHTEACEVLRQARAHCPDCRAPASLTAWLGRDVCP